MSRLANQEDNGKGKKRSHYKGSLNSYSFNTYLFNKNLRTGEGGAIKVFSVFICIL